MDLNDSSESDAFKKKVGADLKVFIKKSSNDYLENLKAEALKGFKAYYDELNNKVNTEFSNQENQQKEMHDKMEQRGAKIAQLKERVINRAKVELHEKELRIDVIRKLKVFSILMRNVNRRQEKRKRKALIMQITQKNKIKKIFNVFKHLALYMPNKQYVEKMKNESKRKFQNFENEQNNQKEEMLKLINQAKEKLKHENRKKIQVKLMLDQMILRGISSLNMQAISLSQNSLTGKSILYYY